MDKYFNYNSNSFTEFIDLYDFNKSYGIKATDKHRLKEDYANKKLTPLVRAFLVYLKMKDNNNRVNDIISTPSPKKQETKKKEIKKKEIKKEEEEEEEEEEKKDYFQPPAPKTNVALTEQEKKNFTKEDFMNTPEFKKLLELNLLPPYVINSLNNPKTAWKFQYDNLKVECKNRKIQP